MNDSDIVTVKRPFHLVFVGGVHGVGKTSFCKELATKLNATHLSAGALIPGPRLPGGRVANVGENQTALVRSLERYDCPTRVLLLDGHYVLRTVNHSIEAIPNSTFETLDPLVLFVLIASPQKIHSQLLRRDGTAPSLDEIDEIQHRELIAARAVASNLAVPLKELSELDPDRDRTAREFVEVHLVDYPNEGDNSSGK